MTYDGSFRFTAMVDDGPRPRGRRWRRAGWAGRGGRCALVVEEGDWDLGFGGWRWDPGDRDAVDERRLLPNGSSTMLILFVARVCLAVYSSPHWQEVSWPLCALRRFTI